MGETVQVRDIDPTVTKRLKDAAARQGISLSEFLRRELARLADQLEMHDRLLGPVRGISGIDIQDVVAIIREERDRR